MHGQRAFVHRAADSVRQISALCRASLPAPHTMGDSSAPNVEGSGRGIACTCRSCFGTAGCASSSKRISSAPVDILAQQDSIFHYPNTITEADFNDWVQERGLYFMSKWDDHFTPLLACHDPGEDPQKGGLLRAQYGKGTYIYAAYAFFRQLPAGVPGAVRLYVNILSAGHEKP